MDMKENIKFIYFDAANTLLHKPLLFTRMQSVLNDAGITIGQEELRLRHKFLSEVFTFPDQTNAGFYLSFNMELLRLIGVADGEELARRIFDACSYLPWEAFEDCGSIGDIGLPMGIISNWDHNLEERLELLAPLRFNPVIGSMKTGVAKPSPALFELAINKCGVEPGEILYIGDSIKLDMEPARRLGMQTVFLDRINAFPFYNGPRIGSLHELKDLIRN